MRRTVRARSPAVAAGAVLGAPEPAASAGPSAGVSPGNGFTDPAPVLARGHGPGAVGTSPVRLTRGSPRLPPGRRG